MGSQSIIRRRENRKWVEGGILQQHDEKEIQQGWEDSSLFEVDGG